MNIKSGLLKTGLFGVVLATFVVGCSGAEEGQGSVESAQSGESTGTPAKKYGGRAAAVTARIDLDAREPASLGDYDNESINLSDTKALSEKGGELTASLATIDAGRLAKAGVANAWVRGEGSKAEASSSTANAALLGAPADGLLGAVLGNGSVNVDLSRQLEDVAQKLETLLPSDVYAKIFGEGALLHGGIKADIVQQDASARCDGKGRAHATSDTHIARLYIGGREYEIIDSSPNQLVVGDPDLVAVYVNAQEISGEGSSAGVDSAAIRVVALGGKVDVLASRASASIECTGTDH